ncbi:hypothetical protein GCM10010112_48920 [Actinoplanes lobatus]|uniref:GNAT superfamily N-acetyltransferase n=1 Tax=Actinoplanes lobatus TaxID=113568 RepID=A0A7W7ML70_9ACTN|nr:N-acetyltransferase [Actinoplanes lobatus]MBB4754051.1 GNAT superfamily N-acetyltransferase [Actinoplanes lobatus]GGN76610.1 hypothetical protein GCM10010112_48920 [Actinoplanes lobatus]GIE40893.1 hypothetical protein Alo02nite_37910 [Actinoplanes lobatus]
MTVVDHASRAELWDRIPALFDGVLPEYNLHGDVMAGYWKRLFAEFGDCQLALVDGESDEVLAVARSIPVAWDPALPGIDAAIVEGFSGRPATALCALGIEVAPAHRGRRHAFTMLTALRHLAASAGLGTLVAPLRPTWKERYPLTPIERYAAWTTESGEPFDPWIRTHVSLGGTLGASASRSSLITGTLRDWEQWTGMAFPESGEYVFPHGLAPLHIDRNADLGTYWEPGVWVVHPAGSPR